MTGSHERRRISTTTILTTLFGATAIVYHVVAHPQHILGFLPALFLLAWQPRLIRREETRRWWPQSLRHVERTLYASERAAM